MHRKNISKSKSGKDMGIPTYFPWIGEKYFHILGNLWKLVSHISELCRFFYSIGFYSISIVWEYISFPNNIPIVWNFTLPILCGLFGFRNNFQFPQKPTAWEWYGFAQNISILWEFVHSRTLGIAWVIINSKLRGSEEDGKSLCFPILFPYYVN